MAGRYKLIFILFLFSSGCGRTLPIGWTGEYRFTPEPPAVFDYEDGVRIAALNTEFMFDGLGEEGGATFPHKSDSILAKKHRADIASVLKMLDADLVLLSEVEHDVAVEMMLNENGMEGLYDVHFVEGMDTFTGQDVALLSKIPVDTVGRTDETIPIRSTDRLQQVSKNMFARMTLGQTPVTLIGVHFLARPGDLDRKPRRELQAEIIRRLAEREIANGRQVIILGDFNDFDNEIPDFIASRPITNVLERLKEAGPGPDDNLRNLLGEVPQMKRFTAHWDRNGNERVEARELSAIDHILLSPELYSRVREVRYVHTYDPTSVTDHFPVVASLSLGDD